MEMVRWFGFIFVVISGALTGFVMANDVRKKELLLQKMESSFRFMQAEMEFHLTPLDELCEMLSKNCGHKRLSDLFLEMFKNMKHFPGNTTGQSVRKALSVCKMPHDAGAVICELFDSLGKQDLGAQIRSLSYAQDRVQNLKEELLADKKDRIRSYRVLGICMGLAIGVVLV